MATELRRKMIEDMQLRDLAERIQASYLDAVKGLARHYMRSPDRITEEEVRGYFLHLINERKASPSTVRVNLAGVRFRLPIRALSPVFRAGFAARVRRALPGFEMPGAVWRRRGVVFSRPCGAAPRRRFILEPLAEPGSARGVCRCRVSENIPFNNNHVCITET